MTSQPGELTTPTVDSAARRMATRAARVSAGLDELDQWLCDQIRTGLASFERSGPAPMLTIAARMVDAQAPAVAARLRRLPAVLNSGDGWHGRLLAQFALLRLLVRAHRRQAELPPTLVAAVRAHVGYPIARDEVLARPAVRDVWAVLALRDTQEDRLIARRVWLLGTQTGRFAAVLSFAPPGHPLDDSLRPGTSLDADLHFYPSGARALVGARHDEPGPLPLLVGDSIEAALAGYTTALTADPWTSFWPGLLAGVVPLRTDLGWVLREDHGACLPLERSGADPWRLIALSGGKPVTVAGEWSDSGFTPICVLRRQEAVPL